MPAKKSGSPGGGRGGQRKSGQKAPRTSGAPEIRQQGPRPNPGSGGGKGGKGTKKG